MLVVTTPAKGAQKVAARVADMARRSYLKVLGVVENMHEFVAPDGIEPRDLRVGRRQAVSPRSPARRSSARCRSTARCRKAATTGKPVVLAHPDLPAARALNDDRASASSTELLPPVEMAGCTARIFELVGQAQTPAR